MLRKAVSMSVAVGLVAWVAGAGGAATNAVTGAGRFRGVGDIRPAVWTVTPIDGTPDSRIQIDIAGFSASEGDGGYALRIPGQALPAPGTPDVPRLTRLLPGHGGFQAVLEVRGLEATNVPDVAVAAAPVHRVEAPEAEVRRLRPCREPDPGIYGRDAFWPPALGRVEEAWIGTQKVVRVECFPIQYNPSRKTICCYRRLEGVLRFERIQGGRAP